MYNSQLETFLCVVESGSFNKAAEKLFISPPAVIKQVNLLEGTLRAYPVRAHPPGIDSDKGRLVPVSGCQVYHPVL